MSFVSVGVVLTGDSFPVQSIRVGDFKFRHRDLVETLRLPVALQAENDSVAMQIFPDRFEVHLKNPDRLDIQVKGLEEMVSTFLEYVGKRTVAAVGHNFGWALAGTADRKPAVTEKFLQANFLRTILDGEPIDPDVSVAFAYNDLVTARVQVNTSAPGDAGVTFNFHHDLSRTSLTDAVSKLSESLDRATIIANNIEESLAEVRTA